MVIKQDAQKIINEIEKEGNKKPSFDREGFKRLFYGESYEQIQADYNLSKCLRALKYEGIKL